MEMMMFNFNLKQKVKIKCSGEEGEVIGRAEYSNCGDQYQVRYKTADGRAEEKWWSEDALTPI